MRFFDHAPGESEADAPSSALGRNPRLENVATNFLRNAGSVIEHPDCRSAIVCFYPEDNRARAALQRIDRILDQGLQRPFHQNRISQNGGASTCSFHPEVDLVGPLRQTWSEVARYPVRQGPQPDWLASGRVSNPLEAPSHPVEALGIGREMFSQGGRRLGQ